MQVVKVKMQEASFQIYQRLAMVCLLRDHKGSSGRVHMIRPYQLALSQSCFFSF